MLVKIDVKEHRKKRIQMQWGKHAAKANLRDLSVNHIQNTREYIKKMPDSFVMNGYTKEDWLEALTTELLYRNKLTDVAIHVMSENTTGDLKAALRKLLLV